jgi:Zn finger protein HypA/HybF involved in hydrogenase expression
MKDHINVFCGASFDYQVYQSDFADQDIKIEIKNYVGTCLNCRKVTRNKDKVDCPNCSHALFWSVDKS